MVMLILLILIFYNNAYTYCQIYMVMFFSTAKSVISLIYAELLIAYNAIFVRDNYVEIMH